MLYFYTRSKQKHAIPFPPNKYSMISSMIFLHYSYKRGMGYAKKIVHTWKSMVGKKKEKNVDTRRSIEKREKREKHSHALK